MTQIVWPNGYADLIHKLKIHGDKILTGQMIAVDPSSGSRDSQPAVAIFEAGVLVFSAELDIPYKKPVYERLQLLYKKVLELTPNAPDVFAIEEIRGQGGFSSHILHWAIGATIAAARTPCVLEVPLNFWKALAKATPSYTKGDVADAEMIGKSIVLRAKELKDAKA